MPTTAHHHPRRVAFAIGIHDAENLPCLPGALNGARGFDDWARAAGYESHLITDEAQNVTFAQLQTDLDAALAGPKPIHRFLLYFAGHGMIRDAEDGLWLLSKWYSEMRAIGVEQLRRRLYMHDIEQIGIFADACRSLPHTVDVRDLTADAVLGRGPTRPRSTPAIDRFTATQDGSETFMIPGASEDEDRCVFSGVLLEGLWGTKAAAFSTIRNGVITSSSLGEYLRAEVPAIARRYECEVFPMVAPAFPEHDNVYFGEAGADPPVFPPWPEPGRLPGPQGLKFRGNRETRLDAEAGSTVEPERAPLRDRMRRAIAPRHAETGFAFALEGGNVGAVWTPPDVFAELHGAAHWWRIGTAGANLLPRPVPILVELANGHFVAVTATPWSMLSIICDAHGAAALVYRAPEPDYDTPVVDTPSVAALALMETGGLRSDRALDLAVELRKSKHADPVLGIVAAYLYESLGDIDSVRRMAWHYQNHHQAVPYDIALLASIEAHWDGHAMSVRIPAVPGLEPRTEKEREFFWAHDETPPARGQVAGFWPTMRQGWAFLDEARDDQVLVTPGLPKLAEHLTAARFTTLSAAGGYALAKLLGLVRRPR